MRKWVNSGAGAEGLYEVSTGWNKEDEYLRELKTRLEDKLKQVGAVMQSESGEAMKNQAMPVVLWTEVTADSAKLQSEQMTAQGDAFGKVQTSIPGEGEEQAVPDDNWLEEGWDTLTTGSTDAEDAKAHNEKLRQEAVQAFTSYQETSQNNVAGSAVFTPPPDGGMKTTVTGSEGPGVGGVGSSSPSSTSSAWAGGSGGSGSLAGAGSGAGGSYGGGAFGGGAAGTGAAWATPPGPGGSGSNQNPNPGGAGRVPNGPGVPGGAPGLGAGRTGMPGSGAGARPGAGSGAGGRGGAGAGRGLGAGSGAGAGGRAGAGGPGMGAGGRAGMGGLGGAAGAGGAGGAGGRGGAAGAGAGAGARGRGQEGEDDLEHETPDYLIGDQGVFDEDLPKVAPPVFGDWDNQR
ncbi:PPE domain-containing protein [Saccharopolyspora endophytica]|uniref:PPE domain-containing protein n=1 Tax=Saccharopolyspora endophytica TaxID=543886 RepID=A0ABS5DJT0_9PSEU|nr:PPE domain-containing protein [Saccharopolyspora endophytica]MBQ0926544.1 PPE domain-containing protein [Saccharopolyspora endophytica]